MVCGFSTNVLFATIKGQKQVNKNGRVVFQWTIAIIFVNHPLNFIQLEIQFRNSKFTFQLEKFDFF